MTLRKNKPLAVMPILISALAALAVAGSCQAADASYGPQYYISGGMQRQWNNKADARLDSINARLGYKVSQNWGFEGEVAVGTGRDTSHTPQYGLTDRLAAYVVGYYPVVDRFELLARLGIGYSRIKNHLQGDSVENGTSTNMGLGAQYAFGEGYAVRADYTHAGYSGHRGRADGEGLSVVKSF